MRFILLFVLVTAMFTGKAQKTPEEKQVLQVVDDFFAALEKQDSTQFRKMFLHNGYIYATRAMADSAVIRSLTPAAFRFRPGQILKERMRPATTMTKVDGGIAMVWAPYDLWVNDTFSHCGVDVFTLIKTTAGWRIASVAYTIETQGCK